MKTYRSIAQRLLNEIDPMGTLLGNGEHFPWVIDQVRDFLRDEFGKGKRAEKAAEMEKEAGNGQD